MNSYWILLMVAMASAYTVPFIVTPDSSQDIVLSLGSEDSMCKFSFKTSTQPSPNALPLEDDKKKRKRTVEEILQAMKGKCFTTTKSVDQWWRYDVCVGGSVTQSHISGETTLNLGKFKHEDGITQFYADGDMCNDNIKTPRSAMIKFGCSTSTSGIVKVDEPKTCYYEIEVVDPAACDNESFPVMKSGGGRRGGNKESEADGSVEEWVLEGELLDNGKAVCTVHRIDHAPIYGAPVLYQISALKFQNFKLEYVQDWSRKNLRGKYPEIDYYTARKAGRKDAGKDIDASTNPNPVITSKSSFSGPLEYLLMVVFV